MFSNLRTAFAQYFCNGYFQKLEVHVLLLGVSPVDYLKFRRSRPQALPQIPLQFRHHV